MSNRRSSTAPFDDDEIITDSAQVAFQEARNGLLQFDRVVALAEKHADEQRFALTPELVQELGRIATEGIRRSAGQFRKIQIYITNTRHVPPPWNEVEALVGEMCEYVNENWRRTGDDLEDALHVSAYLMWRLNWIHPFRDGNGRTSRAISYLVLCVRLGQLLAGSPTIADQIVPNKNPYYAAIDAADDAWLGGMVDVTAMESLISELLSVQLSSAELSS